MNKISINIKIVQGDITNQQVDAIVNAANSELRPGAGVCGAIYKAAGFDELHEETQAIGTCSTGKAVVSKGYNLPAKWIVHAVGPIYGEVKGKGGLRGEDILLKACYENALKAAHEVGARSIAFPAISAGVYGFPLDLAASIAISSCIKYGVKHPDHFDEIVLVCFLDAEFQMYEQQVAEIQKELKVQVEQKFGTQTAQPTSVHQCIYSKSLDQPHPRKCIQCGEPETA